VSSVGHRSRSQLRGCRCVTLPGVNAAVTAVCVVGGLLIGDQLEVVVERVGSRQLGGRPWWRCPSCSSPLSGWGLVPLARGGTLRRGCSECGSKWERPWRPLALAVVTAAVLGAFAYKFGTDVALLAFAVFGVSLVAISAVDLERLVIPNLIVYPTLAVEIPLLVLASGIDGRWTSLWRAAASGAIGFAAFFVVHTIVPRGMGFGDVRLAGLVGLMTGWLGFGHAFVAFFAAFILASVVGVFALALSGQGRKTRIPFGPFLAAGAVFAIVWGDPVVNALFHRGGS